MFIKEHHQGYINWAEYEQNQRVLAGSAYGKASGEAKSGRGGRALLSGLICCGRCGRPLKTAYVSGGGRSRSIARPVYRCDLPNLQAGHRRCLSLGGRRIDDIVVAQMLQAVQPMAVEAAKEAERMLKEQDREKQRIADLELQQARYDASLAERRYAAVDPDNRLIAAQLEKAWENTLQRVHRCQQRVDELRNAAAPMQHPDLTSLAEDLSLAWKAPRTSMRTRQRLVHTLINEIIADLDQATNEVVLVIHWKGGQHSEVRFRKPAAGEHGCKTSEQALQLIASMAARWSDQDIAASLNRMNLPTGQGKTWTAHRVSSIRRVNGIHAYRSAEKDGQWLTMQEAAAAIGVSHHRIRKLVHEGTIKTGQVMPGAPHQISAADLQDPTIADAIRHSTRPRRAAPETQISMFPDT